MNWRDVLRGGNRINWPGGLLVTLALAVFVTIGFFTVTSMASFGPYNPSWDGTSELREHIQDGPDVESELLRNTRTYDDFEAEETVAFVIAPDEPYVGEDAERVREFVENGGTLVVFENFGSAGNVLLSDVGAQARTDGQLLRDERTHYREPSMPIATIAENHTDTTSVEQLTLNYATAIEPNNATVLAATSEYTYLGDEDVDLEEVETLMSYPVATTENVSAGQVVVVGDPSITINAMFDEPDNAAFVRGLYTDHERVVLDHSHTTDVPPVIAAVLTVRETPVLQLLIGAVTIGLIATLSTRRVWPLVDSTRKRLPGDRSEPVTLERRIEPELSEEERVSVLRRRHPEWDDERIRRVARATTRSKAGQEGENE